MKKIKILKIFLKKCKKNSINLSVNGIKNSISNFTITKMRITTVLFILRFFEIFNDFLSLINKKNIFCPTWN